MIIILFIYFLLCKLNSNKLKICIQYALYLFNIPTQMMQTSQEFKKLRKNPNQIIKMHRLKIGLIGRDQHSYDL